MPGIWVAVKATTTAVGSSRYTTLKLWKSRPAAPRMTIRRVATDGYDERGFFDITARARLIPAPGRACCRSAFFGCATWISLRRGCSYFLDFILIPFRRAQLERRG